MFRRRNTSDLSWCRLLRSPHESFVRPHCCRGSRLRVRGPSRCEPHVCAMTDHLDELWHKIAPHVDDGWDSVETFLAVRAFVAGAQRSKCDEIDRLVKGARALYRWSAFEPEQRADRELARAAMRDALAHLQTHHCAREEIYTSVLMTDLAYMLRDDG